MPLYSGASDNTTFVVCLGVVFPLLQAYVYSVATWNLRDTGILAGI